MSQRSKSFPSQDLGAGTTNIPALGQGVCPSASSEFVPAPKLATRKDLEALGQTDSGIPPSEENSFKVGTRVVIMMSGSKYQGRTGTVLRAATECELTTYTVQLDGVSKRVDYRVEDLKPAV